MATTDSNEDNELMEPDVHINPTPADADVDWDMNW